MIKADWVNLVKNTPAFAERCHRLVPTVNDGHRFTRGINEANPANPRPSLSLEEESAEQIQKQIVISHEPICTDLLSRTLMSNSINVAETEAHHQRGRQTSLH